MSRPFHEVAGDMFYGIFIGNPLLRGIDHKGWNEAVRAKTGLADPSEKDVAIAEAICLKQLENLKCEGIRGELALWFLNTDAVREANRLRSNQRADVPVF